MISSTTRKGVSILLTVALAAGMVSGSDASLAAKKTALAKKSLSVEVGKSTQITVKNKKSGAKYLFTSYNKKIIKVKANGKVKGLKEGKTKVTVKESRKVSGKKRQKSIGKVTVTVTKKKKIPLR